jgi:tRNA modification GTPase
MNDTIAAIATAPGRGGIGVVRVSGPAAAQVARALCGRVLVPRMAHLLSFLDAQGEPIDTGIALWFAGPQSYTGEDVLELQGHGGPVVMQMLLERVLASVPGAALRLARPGEFTERAFLNDKLDLAQAEAVADLIDASSAQAARSATRALAGVFSQQVHALVAQLIELRMLVEATLDFPEEEIDFLERSDARGRLATVRASLDTLMAQARQGALLREGLHVVLAGAPNVGKSSLLNALAGAEVAIVTPVAGTTRDRIEQAIQIEGVPLVVVDTAGLRETEDEVERIGIERTLQAVARADVVLQLGEAQAEVSAPMQEIDAAIAAHLPTGTPVLQVWNKIDRVGGLPRAGDGAVWISARTGAGLDLLRAALLKLAGWQGAGEGVFMARERHLQALREAREHLQAAYDHAQRRDEVLDLFAEELRLTQEALNRITGEFGADDLLGEIFGRFCIGK